MSSPPSIRFLRPVPVSAVRADGPRPFSAGEIRTVGLLDNSKDRVEVLLAGLADGLRDARPAVAILQWEKEHHSRRAPAAQLAACAARCQLAVLALAA